MKRLVLLFTLMLTSSVLAQSSPPIDSRLTLLTHTNGTVGVVAAEASDFTAVADSSGSLAGTYLTVHSALDAQCYAVWYKVSGTGTAPVVAGCTDAEVDIATNDTNSTVAGNTRTALNAAPYTNYFAITGATTHVIITNLAKGAATDGSVGTSGFSVSKTQGVSGAAAISPSAVVGGMVGFRVCNNGVNSSTWMTVGNGPDPTLNGERLAPGKCFDCMQCTASLLKSLTLGAQAASNGYSVTQFKQ